MPRMSALVIFVPEAEPLVSPFRSKYDSSAAAGMSAHITINVPFLPVEEDEAAVIPVLKSLFLEYKSFKYILDGVNRFPGVIYLAPSPGQPFKDLIQAIANRFAQSPPYGGEYSEIIPHLTVAVSESKETLDDIGLQFTDASIGKLPIDAFAGEVWLVDNKSGKWIRRVSFALSPNIPERNDKNI